MHLLGLVSGFDVTHYNMVINTDQVTDDMMEQSSARRDEAMAAVSEGWSLKFGMDVL